MVAMIGLACMMMAVVLGFTDPFHFNPDPQLQAIVWACFGIWCFITAWNQRDWRPLAEDESRSRSASANGADTTDRGEQNMETSLRNPLAALAEVHERVALDDLNRAHRYRVAKRAREIASKEPVLNPQRHEVSARVALLKPIDEITDLEELRAIARKLQQIGKANGPNDPRLT